MVPNRERPRSDVDPAGDVILICDEAGHIVEANPPAFTLTGYGPEELLSRPLRDLTPDLGPSEAEACVPEIPAAATLNLETELRRKDGSLRSCSLRMSRSSEGSTRRTVVRIRHRRRASELLPCDERFNQVVLESSCHALLALDEKGRVVFVNRATEELLGRPFGRVRGQTYWEALLPAGPAAAVAEAWRSGFPSLPASGEEEWIGEGGRRRQVAWSLRALPRPEGTAAFVLLTGTDVTPVRELERRHATDCLLIESCGDAIFSKSLEGTILRWNSAAEQLFGYSASEIVGRSVEALLPPEQPDEVRQLVKRIRDGEPIRDFETSRIRKDGRRIQVSLTLNPIRDLGGRVVGAAVVARDLTERRKSEALFRSLLEAAPEAMVIADQDGTITLANAQAGSMFGYRKEDLENHPAAILVPERLRERCTAFQKDYLQNPGIRTLGKNWELFAKRRDGSEFPVEVSISPLETPRGMLYSASLRDLTEQRKAERRLETMEAVSRVLMECATAKEAVPRLLEAISRGMEWDAGGLWQFDESSGTLRCAEVWTDPAWGDSAFGDHAFDLAFPPGAGVIGRVYQSGVPAASPALALDLGGLPLGGSAANRLSSAFAFPLSAGRRVVGVLSLFARRPASVDAESTRVLTALGERIGENLERRRAEEALRASETRLRKAETIARLGSWERNLDEECATWSPGLFRLFGVSPKTFRTTLSEIFRLIHPDDRERMRATIGRAVREGHTFDTECRMIRHDGQELHILARTEILRDERGRAVRVSGIAQDVTERKHAEDEVRRLNVELESRVRARTGELQGAIHEMEAFNYAVAHDLRAPLRALHGMSDLLLSEYGNRPLDETGQDYLRRIQEASLRMDKLTQDLLDYAGLRGKALLLEPVDVQKLARDAVSLMADQLHSRGALVRIEEGCDVVRANRILLGQALTNLLSNAIKFVGPGVTPDVRISARRTENRIRLAVEDNGIGVPPQYLDRMFGIFQRLNRQEDYPGTGIGLALVRRSVERMGGQVGVLSEPGKGSTFWMDLPAA